MTNEERTELIAELRDNWEMWGSPTREKCINESCMAVDCKDAADEIERLLERLSAWELQSQTEARLRIEAERKLDAARSQWAQYRAYLVAKYPPKPGETWAFTCPEHLAIEELLK